MSDELKNRLDEDDDLDDLLSCMDEISPLTDETEQESKISPVQMPPNESPTNETLYTSAFADQTWLELQEDSKTEEGTSKFENYCSREMLLSDLDNDDDATPVVTPIASKIADNQLEDELLLLRNRVESLQKELTNRKQQTNSPESYRRVAALQNLLHDSSSSALSTHSLNLSNFPCSPKLSGSAYSDNVLDDFSNSCGSKTERIALEFASDKKVSELREKAKNVSNKLRRSISVNTIHHETKSNSSNSSPYDPFFGICVNNPLISSATFQAYVGDRKKVRLSHLAVEKKISWDDWVTMAVLIERSPRRKSVKGNDYVIWKLSDMRDCKRLVRVFLFGDDCINKLFKLASGSVLALLNASPMPKLENSERDDMFTLKVENAQKVLEIGTCPEFAFCKGCRKTDGKRCTSVVNKSVSEFCDFHVQSQYKKLASKRGEFQSSFNKPPKSYEKGICDGSGLTTVKIFPVTQKTSTSAKKPQALDLLNQISAKQSSEIKVKRPDDAPDSSQPDGDNGEKSANKCDTFVDLLRRPTIGTRNLLKQISHPNFQLDVGNKKSLCVQSGRQFLASYSTQSSSVKNDLAKAKAAAIVKKKYGAVLPKEDPNNLYKRHPIKTVPNSSASIANVLEDKSPEKKRQKLGDMEINKEKLESLLAKKSNHEDLVDQDDLEKQELYFKVMESKEKIEQRASEMMEIKNCRVVTCKTCDYTWHAQSDVCKTFAHKVLWHNAEKKFFKCKQCKKRSVAYGKYPSKPCDGCKSTTYERVAMRDERRGPKLINEQLKIRGDEEVFLS